MKIKAFDPYLNIEFINKTSNSKIKEWSDKWVTVRFIMNLNGFSANFNSQQLFDDFVDFKNSIDLFNKNKTNQIDFYSLEESFYLQGVLTENEMESMSWTGYLMYPIGDGNVLNFRFKTHISNIQMLYEELIEVCSLYD